MTNSTNTIRKLSVVLIAAGVFLHIYTAITRGKEGEPLLATAFVLWLSLPYFVAFCIHRLLKKYFIAIGCSGAALTFDVYIHLNAFYWSQSTGTLMVLATSPILNLVFYSPIGMFIAWLLSRLLFHRKNAA